jgi:hypothetical protein
MTTSLQTDPRRTARDAFRKPGRPPLEMPVLFQLADLTLLHLKVAPPKALAAVVEPPALPEIIAPSGPIAEAAAPIEPPKVEAAKEETPSPEAPAAEAPKLEVPQVETQPELIAPQVATEPKEEALIADEKTADSQASVPETSEPSPTDVTPPQDPTAPSLRQRGSREPRIGSQFPQRTMTGCELRVSTSPWDL